MTAKDNQEQQAIYPDLKGKTFLVTGASSGIGQAVAIALGQQGSNVVLTGRNEKRLQETASQIATSTTLYPCDLANIEQRNALADAMPQLDGICHSAGIINPFPIRYLDDQQFDKVFNINAKAPILLTAKLLNKKKLNNDSSIVFISSVSSSRAMKGGSAYTISKSAIEAFSRTVTLEHTAQRIRSNCIKAGLVETDIYKQAVMLVEAANSNKSNSAHLLRLAKPHHIAASTLFLLSLASQHTTSTELTIDGGFSCQI